MPLWSDMRALYVYQEMHGRDVLVAEEPVGHGQERLEEESAVSPHCWPPFTQMKEKHRRLLSNQGHKRALGFGPAAACRRGSMTA